MSQYSIDAGAENESIRLVEQLVDFDGPPEQFLVEMLAAHCRGVGATAAALLRFHEDGGLRVAATYPALDQNQSAPSWLRTAVRAMENGTPEGAMVHPMHAEEDLYGQDARENLLILPLRRGGKMRGAAAYHLATHDQRIIAQAREQLAWAVGLLSLYELRLSLQQQTSVRRSLESAQQVLADVNGHRKFQAAAMAFCNELVDRCQGHRVSIGFLRGKYVKVVAMSHTEKFTRKMRFVQDLEAAMEEALDQDLEVIHPSPEGATVVTRATGELSRQHGPSAVLSIPIRYEGEPVAIITLEREAERPWSSPEVTLLRLACELCAARLVELHERDRWIGARMAKATRAGLAVALGPRHTWIKLLALLALGLILFLVFAKGTYRVEAPFVIEAVEQRSIPSPFEGQLAEVHVQPGDEVVAGQTVLAHLRTEDLELKLNEAQAERRRYLREADIAIRQGDQAERQMAEARAEEAQARIQLFEYRLENARIVAPIDGVVVEGAYHEREGAPVDKGAELFRVAPLDSLRATLMVPEDRVLELLTDRSDASPSIDAKALSGEIATAAAPGQRIPIEVWSVHPKAQVVNQKNVFRVRSHLVPDGPVPGHLRPGMEGLAKVDIGRRRYAWIWTRELVNWVRMKLWL